MNSEDVAIGDLREPPGKLVSGFRWSRFKDASSSEEKGPHLSERKGGKMTVNKDVRNIERK
jgi:hypothetical protein